MDSFDLIPLLLFAGVLAVLVTAIVLLSRQLMRQRTVQAIRARQRQLSDRLARELSSAPAGAEHTQDLVDSQLFLKRAAAGTERSRIRLRDVVRESLERMSPAIAGQGFALRVHQGGDPQVNADAGALGHALDQLLKLGLRSVGQRHIIQAQLTTQGKQAEISVLADGMILDGLQLAVVRQMLEVQGGEVLMDHTAIRMRLPLAG